VRFEHRGRRLVLVQFIEMDRRALLSLAALSFFCSPAHAEFTKFTWKTLEQPAPRETPGFSFDSTRNRAVLFGGQSNAGALNDTWEWNGKSWNQGNPFIRPPARNNAGMIYDATQQRTGLFGGAGANVYGDTWLWNGSSWLSAQPLVSPSSRVGPGLSYDPVRSKWVLFGGRNASGQLLNDTWEYDSAANTWKSFSPPTLPNVRWFGSMAFHKGVGKTIMLGGIGDFNNPNDMWEWNGSLWVQLEDDNANDPAIRFGGAALVYDEMRTTLVSFGGIDGAGYDNRTFEYTYGQPKWNELHPAHRPAVSPAIGAYDLGRQRTLVYQGSGSDLWEWDGIDWIHRGPGVSPPTRGFGQVTYDGERKRVVLFGGSFGSPLGDTWEWDGGSWQEFTPAQKPSPRYAGAFAYDSTRKETLLFSGMDGMSPTPDTWVWNGATWSQRAPAQSPAPTLGPATAHDANRGKTVMFGGLRNGPGGLDDYSAETWEWNGVTWTQATPLASPPARIISAMEYDAEHKNIVLFGGSVNIGFGELLADTWTYDGTTWTKQSPAHHPTARYFAKLTYDANRKKVVMYGGVLPDGSSSSELWQWDGTDWSQIDLEGAPITSGNTLGFSFDGNTLISFGTIIRLNNASNTLLLVPKTDTCSADADCANDTYCVDGVCCQSKSCNPCETCNGLSRGTCTPIFNDEDPNGCATGEGKSCNASGACLAALGSTCADGTTCASGFCVDGVCCETKCEGTCIACSASLKEDGARSGLCGAAKSGSDPRDQCSSTDATTCGLDGTCDGRGACRVYPKGTKCGGTGGGDRLVCDGLGECSNDTACFDDTHRLSADGKQGESCGGFKCGATGCLTGCTSIDDCDSDHVCDFNGRCVEYVPPVPEEGCSSTSGPASRVGMMFVAAFTMIGARVRRRRKHAA